MFRRIICLTSFALLLGLAVDSQAATRLWLENDGTDRLWSTSANWKDGLVPGLANNASISGANGPIITNEGAEAAQMWIYTGNLTVDGGTLVTNSNINVGHWKNNTGILDVIIGSLLCKRSLTLGTNNSSGTLNITGGDIKVNNTFMIGSDPESTGVVNLDDGTITVGDLVMARDAGAVGTMNIKAGTLIIDGDEVATVQGYIDNGWITAYGGAQNLVLDYGVRNFEQTTLTAVPEPATMMLLSIGALGLLRRKR